MGRFVKISDMTEEEKKKWKEKVNARYQEGLLRQQQERERVNNLDNNVSNTNFTEDFKTRNLLNNSANNVLNRNKETLKRKNIIDKSLYVDKKTGAGLITGTVGIGQAGLTDMASKIDEGSKQDTGTVWLDLLANSTLGPAFTGTAKAQKDTMDLLNDNSKNGWEKALQLGLNTSSYALDYFIPGKALADSVLRHMGHYNPQTKDLVMEANNFISKPVEEMNMQLAKEGEEYDKVTQLLGDAGHSIGNMIPSMAVTALTKNPTAGLTVMAASTKGQATQEALNNGATLEQAKKIGDAKMWIEVGTEKLTGGLNYFGKGWLDDFTETGLKKIKNDVIRKFAEKGLDIGEEIGEETISDLLGFLIDKGTVDPNAEYTWEDWLDTATTTAISTYGLNKINSGIEKISEKNANKKIYTNENESNIKTNIPATNLAKDIANNMLNLNQNGNIATLNNNTTNDKLQQQNIANTQNSLYNINESESGVNGNFQQQGMLESDRVLPRVYENSLQQEERRYTRTEYEQWEQSIRQIEDNKLTNEQQKIRNTFKGQYGKDIVFFDGNTNNNIYSGGASYLDSNRINIDIRQAENFGLNKMAYHELLESNILHNQSIKLDIIEPTIRKIISDENFEMQKKIFWENQKGNIPNDYLIAKDMLCDRYSEIKTGEDIDYTNMLSQETNMTIDFAIENFEKQINKNILPIDKNAQQVGLPTNNNMSNSNENKNIATFNAQTINNMYQTNNANKIQNNTHVNNNSVLSKTFKQDIEKFKNGKYSEHDNIVLLDETPQYLYNLGCEYEQPIVINMNKLETIMKEPKGNFNGKNQHGITMDLIEQLPYALTNPLNVIKNPKFNNRFVIITELTDQYGDIVIVPIQMNTKGYVEGIENDVNRIASVYGKENYDLSKTDDIDSYMEQNKNNIVYDIDMYKRNNITENTRLQLPSTNNNIVSNKSISQNSETVKSDINNNFMQDNENNTLNNGIKQNIKQTSNMLNNKELPLQGYTYEKSDNVKIDNLRKDANIYFNNSEQTHNYIKMLEKIIEDKNVDIRLNPNLKTEDGRIANGSYSNGVITINPNSTKTGEFIAIHELTHAIGTKSMRNIIDTYRKSNSEFNTAVEQLLQNYNTTEITEEALSDISAQLFGNQEFINNIAQNNPNIFQKIYSEIKYLWHQFRGYKNQNQFVEDLYYKWTQAYNSNDKISNNSYYSIQTDNNGKKYIKVDTDQNIFNGIDKKDYNKIAKMYMQDYLMGKTTLNNSDIAIIDSRSTNKYTNPTQKPSYMTEKMKLTPELKNVLEIAKKESISLPTKENSKYRSWEYYKFNFELNEKKFEGTVNIGIDKNGNRHFYEINKIHSIPNSSVSTNKADTMNLSNNSITSSNEDVNTTKYSMQESENNSNWNSYLEKNFKSKGTTTNLSDIKLPLPKNKTKDIGVPNTKNKVNTEILTDADYDVLNKIYEKEGKTEILTEKKKAKILEKYTKDKITFKDSFDILAQKFVNKGHYIDQLAKRVNNPELKFIYDRNLNSFAEGQYVIGVAQTDNKGNKIGKSINEIWEPIERAKLTKEFSEYLLNKHNIDRSEKNKFVFGKEIGPAESTAIALELENKYPEFKKYAEDIKKFNHNNLVNMRDSGLITQEAINDMERKYPNYVPISRNLQDSLYVGSNEETGIKSPIKRATGGNSDIQPIKDTMAGQVIRIKRLINQNELGKELAKSLSGAVVNENVETKISPNLLFDIDTLVDTDVDGTKYYLYFENGIQQKIKINDNLYESLRPTEINKLEKTLPVKALQKVSNVHRGLLTSNNPLFIATNFFKDFQDGAFNSKYSSKFVKNYGKALQEIYTKGKYYESYMANGGMSNTYFDYNEGIKNKSNKFVEHIRNANEIVEQLPRLAEFISTLEDGKSLNEALYNAAEITTNFKRGGDLTKAINRNGFNFLNASVQGFDKQFRNFSGQNGAKGYVNLLVKANIMGVLPAVLNHILLKDDEDYQKLPQSTKDLYYLFKYDDGKFIRIPKGRVLSIFGSVARRVLETTEGQDDAWEGFGSTVVNQVAPNNPLEDNILAPVTQVIGNKTWYGGDLVSSRLQKELPENQYDETTDEFSKWLGKQLKASPKKINYLIDQYSGGVGDIVLPMITPQAKENVVIDKFTTDSVLKNKNVSKFYETLEKQTQIANDNFATDEDELQLKYLTGISKEMGELYKEKRQVQMSNISNEEKKKAVREIQAEINELAEKGLQNYKITNKKENSSKIGDNEYYKNSKGDWTALTDEEKEKNENISTETYSDYKQKVYNKKNEKVSKGELKKSQDLKNKDKIQILLDSKYSQKEKMAIYENYIISSNDKEFKFIKASNMNFEEYLKFKQQDFTSDKTDDGTLNGKTVSKSKQKKVTDYLNDVYKRGGITGNQSLLLYAMQGYSTTSKQKNQLVNYITNLNLKPKEKAELFNKFSGFTVYKDGNVKW